MTAVPAERGLPGYRSPLLDLPGAVPAAGVEAGVALHYGDPLGEQRTAMDGVGLVDFSNRSVIQVSGSDRLSWLDAIAAKDLAGLADATSARAAFLDPRGYIRFEAIVTELGGQTWLVADPELTAPMLEYLNPLRFMLRIGLADVSGVWSPLALVGPGAADVLERFGVTIAAVPHYTAVSLAGAGWLWRLPLDRGPVEGLVVPRVQLRAVTQRLLAFGVRPVGVNATEMMRVARRTARLGCETDDHTYPNEVGFVGGPVSVDKCCYPGRHQVASLLAGGRPPPRRLVRLRLECPPDAVPPHGTPLSLQGRPVGSVGTSGHHVDLGPTALALVASDVPDDAVLDAAGVPAPVDTRP